MRNFTLFFVMLFLVSGCASTKPKQVRRTAVGGYTMDSLRAGEIPMQDVQRFMALDEDAATAVTYVKHAQARMPSGQVKIEAYFQNLTDDKPIYLEWKAVFYDGARFQIEESDWQQTLFPPNEMVPVTINSISPNAADFTIMFRTLDLPTPPLPSVPGLTPGVQAAGAVPNVTTVPSGQAPGTPNVTDMQQGLEQVVEGIQRIQQANQ